MVHLHPLNAGFGNTILVEENDHVVFCKPLSEHLLRQIDHQIRQEAG
jgi:hypothetical protein